ncbi:hypothetical protein BDD21_5266 [Thiocapsa rosea]|uniref:Uncharacterized protein n=1 Tax=Thiocapsa rosea TaxID=69360 RepID=A0A495VE77_9GAMM|nr:hypothetical protein BDD21_5266 [Thiocapsa rosea]
MGLIDADIDLINPASPNRPTAVVKSTVPNNGPNV